jgi:parallel beta-helix repeat protein
MPRNLFICIVFVVALLLIYVMFTFKFGTQPVGVHGKIFIRQDGSVVPSTAPIKREGDVYVFTEDIINKSIVVERSNVEIDGAEHKLQGFGILNGSGFDLNNVKGATIKRVKISKFYWSVHMHLCSCCELLENEMSNNAYGIYPNWSNNSIIAGNNIMNNEGGGIYLTNSFNFSVEGNVVAFNRFYGIRLTNSDNCTVTENVIADNRGNGIHMVLSSNNVVYHNNFVNNTKQAYIEGNAHNVWDDGYPSGGNYWSDYAGEDANDDDIGDTPYAIDENNVDRYPLIKPREIS